MYIILCGFVSTLTDKLSWLYQEHEWTRQELLLIVLGLSVLLLVLLRRRRKKSVRTVHPEHFADRSSVIGAKLADRRHSRFHFGDSRKGLPANVSAKHEKSPKVGKVTKQEQRSEPRAGRAQWETAKRRPFGGGPGNKVTERAAGSERLGREAIEAGGGARPLENKIAELAVQAQPQAAKAGQAESAFVQRIDELTTANEQLLHEAQEHKQAQDRFERKLIELTAANEQLQKQVGELTNTGAKRRVYTYEDEHRLVDHVKQKLCRKCGEWKNESEFHKNASRKDGLARWCKMCKIGAARKSRARRAAPNQ